MHEAFARALKELGATMGGPEVWGWFGRTLSARIESPERGACWLRVVSAPQDKATGKIWEGNREAARLFDGRIRKPVLYGFTEMAKGGKVYVAELSQHVDEQVCSTTPVLAADVHPLDQWWDSLRIDLGHVARTPTDRVAVRQEWADRSVPHFLEMPAPRIVEWETAHGDLHPANLTGTTPYLLDWEGFGRAPVGYDPAMLLGYSLLNPEFAQRVRDTFPVLNTEPGRVAQIVVLTELMQPAARGDCPELVPALRALAAELA
ncbi:hypothetical protein ABZX40_27875 [Streptomyces sp. NPDC004610]|uniref:hypothetical protein n=1 Tax=unclassified Streptomyces TaxID=2593676 RepID=UPI0033AC2AC4